MLGGIIICLRKRDPSAYMIIHILFVQMLQLHSQSVLICIVNITLTTKYALHTLQFARGTADIYYTTVGLEKSNVEQRTEKPITEATLIPMYHRVERANYSDHSF